MKGLAAASLALALLLLGCNAKILESNVEIDDRALIPLTEAFGYADGGKLIITLKDISIYQKHSEGGAQGTQPNFDNFGFILSPVEADTNLELDLAENKCILRSVKHSLFTFKDSAIQGVYSGENPSITFNLTQPKGGAYYLYFVNCEPDTPVSFSCHIEMFNIDKRGNPDYLSVGDTELSTLYWVMFSVFTAATAYWMFFVWKNKGIAHKIHWLMGLLGAFKALTLLSQALMYHFLEVTGNADGWNWAFYIFTFCRGVLFFTIVVLIGTGWSYMKPFLGDREKRILLVVIPLQVFANIAIIVTDEGAPSDREWFTWRDIFHLVDIICCCAILFPIVWSIKHLREAAQTDGKAARSLEKLQLFRQFYVMVVVYIYFTRIVVYLLKSTVDYEYSWLADMADEVAALLFYVWTAWKFQPYEENPYLKLNQGEIEL